jgi:hypothetical protein
VNDLQNWSLLVGVVAPLAVAIIQQPGWRPAMRAVVTVLCCLLLAAGTAYFTGAFNGRGYLSALLLVFVGAITAYKGLWKPTGIAPAIETKTSPAN